MTGPHPRRVEKNKLEGRTRATHVHKTQADAEREGRAMAIRRKTEHIIHGQNGQIRQKNSYGNGRAKLPARLAGLDSLAEEIAQEPVQQPLSRISARAVAGGAETASGSLVGPVLPAEPTRRTEPAVGIRCSAGSTPKWVAGSGLPSLRPPIVSRLAGSLASVNSNGNLRLVRAEKNEEAFKHHNERHAKLEEGGGCPPDEPVPFSASAMIPHALAPSNSRSLSMSGPSHRQTNS